MDIYFGKPLIRVLHDVEPGGVYLRLSKILALANFEKNPPPPGLGALWKIFPFFFHQTKRVSSMGHGNGERGDKGWEICGGGSSTRMRLGHQKYAHLYYNRLTYIG